MRAIMILTLFLLFFFESACSGGGRSSSFIAALPPVTVITNVPGDEAPISNSAAGPVRDAVPSNSPAAATPPVMQTYSGIGITP